MIPKRFKMNEIHLQCIEFNYSEQGIFYFGKVEIISRRDDTDSWHL